MAQRIFREQPNSVKQKISTALKSYHAQKSERAKQHTRNAQAASMRQYWQNIPHRPLEDDSSEHTTMNDLL